MIAIAGIFFAPFPATSSRYFSSEC